MMTCHQGCNDMPNMECLVGQLIAGVTDLKDEIKELKVEMKDLKEEMKTDTDKLEVNVDSLMELKQRGAGILIATGVFFTTVGWCVNHFFGK